MITRRHALILCLAATTAMTLGGCARYFRVTDPDSGRVYFTRRIQRGFAGQIKFTDARTGGRVRLDSSEVKKVSEGEYHDGLSGQRSGERLRSSDRR